MMLIAASSTLAQQPDFTQPGSYSVKTANGYIFIRNGKEKSLRFEVVGKIVEPKEVAQNHAFVVDGRLIQVLIVDHDQYEPSGKAAISDLLETHLKWESEYLASEVFGEIKTEKKLEKIAGRDVLFWWFKRPKFDQEFDRDYFATTLFGDKIFGISSPVTKGADYAEYRKIFDGIFGSLQIQDKPFDVEKIATEIRNSAAAGS